MKVLLYGFVIYGVVITANLFASATESVICLEKCRKAQQLDYTECLVQVDPLDCQDDADTAYKKCTLFCVVP